LQRLFVDLGVQEEPNLACFGERSGVIEIALEFRWGNAQWVAVALQHLSCGVARFETVAEEFRVASLETNVDLRWEGMGYRIVGHDESLVLSVCG
jgi:hypothetical protein